MEQLPTIGHTLIIHKIDNAIYYTPNRCISDSNVHCYTFCKEYTLCYIVAFNAITGDCKVRIDHTRITKAHYAVWYQANDNFLSTLQIKGLFI